ncbi:MAG: archaeoflavoprotein AfpA [Candidatus Methanomethylicota archaeon]|uniref:Archaeoflavoprotein AfpA n=1 Tax=Thermoproteota archaeon TaxID=2056631 RepID=A0A497F0B2_9CREN|nr:MAG: archaeoflavoprotein AfpA [Candidatus Verstraetearchaeota archaeon]RLE52759.1 MAG: archaeoflavoprotein AfpA [Candidatus Verstraetearchaeota archaeon]
MKIAWGITGAGDRLEECVKLMKSLADKYRDRVEVYAYISKSGVVVLRHYRLLDYVRSNFKTFTEISANEPFLAGQLQKGEFEFLLIMPATSNTVAKLAVGIADTLLTNAAISAVKAFKPVYIFPTDREEGLITTKLPNGKELVLRVRKEDAENVRKLREMEGFYVLNDPREVESVIEKHLEDINRRTLKDLRRGQPTSQQKL